jgi:DNA replication protein DnaC
MSDAVTARTTTDPAGADCVLLAKSLRLPTAAAHCEAIAETARTQDWDVLRYLAALLQDELAARSDRRIRRLLQDAQLPPNKTLGSFDFAAVPSLSKATCSALATDDSWVDQGANLLLFGPSGTGKTHLAAALLHEHILRGRSARFYRTTDLVQHLQLASSEHRLPAALKRLDRYQLLALDDIGYIQRDRGETSVLFELICHRYEQRSVIVTSNHAFSAWEGIFPDPSMTVAVVDRLVHHSRILELNTESYRRRTASRGRTPEQP